MMTAAISAASRVNVPAIWARFHSQRATYASV